ncbi:hypothetical protein RIF29_39791 [Crotalaria pallida]|uniref:RING-type E3 ubiquitin transferase n=1 Tax=Crotalaria pallida TaxID=3830 RepID=A0AAN9E4C0_CROPI
MNDRFPDATPEELNTSDATCIMCRKEMTTAKKIICGHLFHVHCLRSWLERQHTCPTCRALVVQLENGTTAVGGQQGSQSYAHQHAELKFQDIINSPSLDAASRKIDNLAEKKELDSTLVLMITKAWSAAKDSNMAKDEVRNFG